MWDHMSFDLYFLWLNINRFSYYENKFRKQIGLQHSFVRKINKLLVFSLKCSCNCVCRFCNTFSSVAVSFCSHIWKFEVIGAYGVILLSNLGFVQVKRLSSNPWLEYMYLVLKLLEMGFCGSNV